MRLRIVVLGGTRFIGRRIVDELAAFDPEVVLDCAAFGARDADAVLALSPTPTSASSCCRAWTRTGPTAPSTPAP